MGLDSGASEVRVQATEVVVTAPTVKLGSVAAVRPAAFGDTVDANSAAITAWAAGVNAALAALGAAAPPLAALASTVTAKTKVE